MGTNIPLGALSRLVPIHPAAGFDKHMARAWVHVRNNAPNPRVPKSPKERPLR